MDSTDPYTENSSFVNLLNSIPIQANHNPQYENLSPTMQVGSPEDVAERQERRKWTPKEDLVLISAWLNTSKDPIVGNEQKAGAFWKRILAYFNSSPQLVGLPPRQFGHCKQRWGRINDQVCKFVGCYKAAMKQQSSGQNENDVMKAAHEIYFNDHQIKFTLHHAWRELRHDQKWCTTLQAKDGGGKSKRKKLEDGTAESTSSQPESHGEDEVMGRPSGVKAAKAKAQKSGSKRSTVEEKGKSVSVSEYQSMWDIKKQDLEMKDKLAKTKLLESLLGKSEQLSDMEVALKNKLISDMLS